MLMTVTYVGVICLVIIYLIFIAYVKFTYPFWSRLNMHHSYNILNCFSREGIISSAPLEKSKWTNTFNVKILKQQNLTESQRKEIVAFIRRHRIMNKKTLNRLTIESLTTSLRGHNKPCFVGLYYEKHYKDNDNNHAIGLITSRPLSVRIGNKFFTSYFLDNLVIHRDQKHDTDNIAPQLIHTTIFKQQQVSSSRTCLLERQGRLNIPTKTLLAYETFLFSMMDWKSCKMLPSLYQLVRIDQRNIHILSDIMIQLPNIFKCSIVPCWSNMLDMITHRRIIVDVISHNGTFIALYIMRDPCIMYSDSNVIECISAINLSKTSDVFVFGFNDLLVSMRREYKHVIIHDTSHNKVLIDNIRNKHSPLDNTVNHVFLYNFIQPSLKGSDCIIIN
jgi:hypothetical protein